MLNKRLLTLVLLVVVIMLPNLLFAQGTGLPLSDDVEGLGSIQQQGVESGGGGSVAGAHEVKLADTGFEKICSIDPEVAPGGLAGCIQRIYLFSLGLGSILAVFMIVLAGYKYMTAQGNAQQVENAKESFASAFVGLIVLFVAFIILNTINPDLTNFQDLGSFDSKLEIPPIGGTASVSLTPSAGLVSLGDPVSVTWFSEGVSSCTGSGTGFDTQGEVSGTVSVGPFLRSPSTEMFIVKCMGESGVEVSDDAFIQVR